jgi:hypothetical protein
MIQEPYSINRARAHHTDGARGRARAVLRDSMDQFWARAHGAREGGARTKGEAGAPPLHLY